MEGYRRVPTALISNIQRYSIHDGSGIRTTVFLKGCPLRCFWCANPENRRFEPEIMTNRNTCRSCLSCVAACPAGAMAERDGHSVLDRERCTRCGQCAAVCPYDAVRVSGQTYTPEKLLERCRRDQAFYRGKGGVTLSGGEPLAFGEFCTEFARLCRRSGLQLVFETCGFGEWDTLKRYSEMAAGIYFDVKHGDEQKHREITGVSNRSILRNLARLTDEYDRVTVRVPVIYGVNDTSGEMGEIARCIAAHTGKAGILGVELLPFHNFGMSKFAGLDLEYRLKGKKNMPPEEAARFLPQFEEKGIRAVVGS